MSEMSQGLHNLADFVEAHPDFEQWLRYPLGNIMTFTGNREEFVEAVRMLKGERTKDADTGFYFVRRKFSSNVAVEVNVRREEVCERVHTGTKIVKKPNPVLLDQVPLVDVEELQYKWVCDESILRGA